MALTLFMNGFVSGGVTTPWTGILTFLTSWSVITPASRLLLWDSFWSLNPVILTPCRGLRWWPSERWSIILFSRSLLDFFLHSSAPAGSWTGCGEHLIPINVSWKLDHSFWYGPGGVRAFWPKKVSSLKDELSKRAVERCHVDGLRLQTRLAPAAFCRRDACLELFWELDLKSSMIGDPGSWLDSELGSTNNIVSMQTNIVTIILIVDQMVHNTNNKIQTRMNNNMKIWLNIL